MSFGFGSAAPAPATGFSFGQPVSTTAPAMGSTTATTTAATGAAAGGFSFGAAATTAPSAAAGGSGPSLGGFGGLPSTAPPAPAFGAASTATAATDTTAKTTGAGGFGFGAAPAASAAAATTTTTTATTAPTAPTTAAATTTTTAATAPTAAAGVGFSTTGSITAPAAVPAGSTSLSNAAPPQPPQQTSSQEFGGKTLASIIGKLDKTYAADIRDFTELSRHVLARDRNIAERTVELAVASYTIRDAVVATKATASSLDDCQEKQQNIAKLLEDLEDAVNPAYARMLAEAATRCVDGESASAAVSRPFGSSGGTFLGGGDMSTGPVALPAAEQTRVEAYTAAIALFDDVQALQQRLDAAVVQHRHARRGVVDAAVNTAGLRQSSLAAANTNGNNNNNNNNNNNINNNNSSGGLAGGAREPFEEVHGMIALAVSQLSALESCGVLAERLEKELDGLLGRA